MAVPLIWIYFFFGLAAGVIGAGLVGWLLHLHSVKRVETLYRENEERLVTARRSLEEELASARSGRIEAETALEEERIRNAVLSAKAESIPALKAELEQMGKTLRELGDGKTDLERRNGELAARLEAEERQKRILADTLNEREKALEKARDTIVELEKKLSGLTIRLDEEREQGSKTIRELKEAREVMQKEFKILAARIMEENSQRFSRNSREKVEQVLKPLQQQVEAFRKRIEDVHSAETREMAALLNEIRNLKTLNQKISQDAVNLTKALRGESKQQGIWGEMVLERVLEASGLRENEEYEREVSLRDGEQKRFRPDVIVHLPEGRDIIIDAKTSLRSYERYVAAESEEERAMHARAHLEAVKAHIDRLSDKSYTRLEGVNALDFIFMFMPIEGALMLALQEDPRLYDRAFGRQIVLVSPTTLLVALRAVENTWRHERQNKNAQEIARRAGALYDKFAVFATELEKLGRQLDTVQKTYEGAWNRLSTGRGNIVRQIENIRELGAKTSKRLPAALNGIEEDAIEEPESNGK